MHLVMFALTWDEELRPIELDIVLGPRFLLTSHPPEWRPIKTRDVARLGVEHFLSQGTDLLLYAVVDPVVDGYFPVIDRLSDEIDLLEDQVVANPSKPVLERLFRIRRDLLEVRHMVGPEREVFNQLTNRDNPLIAQERADLLPGRVRPPHPRHRRAGHPPRAALRGAGGLPVHGQQRPVRHHEAADRGHGRAGGHRRGRGHLRHERGGVGAEFRRAAGVLDRHRVRDR